MSREELVSSYLAGTISRRTFARRLVAMGVSAGAAVSYAQLLSQEKAQAADRQDFYGVDGLRVRIITSKLERLIAKWRLKILIHTDELAEFKVIAEAKIDGDTVVIARKELALSAGSNRIRIKIRKEVRDKIAEQKKLNVTLTVTGHAPPDNLTSVETDKRQLD
jgi:hypothetical protein